MSNNRTGNVEFRSRLGWGAFSYATILKEH
jgi:hypothetical protein